MPMIKYIIALLAIINIFNLSAIDLVEEEKVKQVVLKYSQPQTNTWSTLSWGESPLVITFENGHIYAFGLKTPSSAWQKRQIEDKSVFYTEKDRWGLIEVHLSPWFDLDGEQVFVYRMVSRTRPLDDVAVLAHERFHRHQMEHFQRTPVGMSKDHLNIANLTWSEMEDALFRAFLTAQGSEKQEIIKDIAAVHSFRHSIISEPSRIWEKHQMKMEGLADYVGTHMFGGEASLLRMHASNKGDGIVDEAIKWRHYLAGATLAYALDALNVPQWKERVESGADLTSLFLEAVALTPEERDARLIQVKKRLSYAKRRKAMTDRVNAYQEELDDVYAKYEEKNGVKLFLDHPPTSISGGGSNLKLYYLADGSTVNIDDESTSTTRDGNWKFSTRNVSHLFQHKNGIREVKVSKSAKVVLDNVSHTLPELLNHPRKYSFNSIKIEGREASFQSEKHQGVLISDGKSIKVSYAKRAG